jgi:hypothetical protein
MDQGSLIKLFLWQDLSSPGITALRISLSFNLKVANRKKWLHLL